MLVLAGAADNFDDAVRKVAEALSSGRALEKFAENTELQGGDTRVCDDPESLLDPHLCKVELSSPSSGYVSGVDAHEIGHCVVAIGGGRIKAEDPVDHAVGFECLVKIGDQVVAGQPLAVLYCRDTAQADEIRDKLLGAFSITESEISAIDTIQGYVS